MQIEPNTKKAYRLLHEGVLALSRVEESGIRVDVGYLKDTIKRLDRGIDKGVKYLKGNKQCREVWKFWKKKYGSKMKIQATEQLAHVLVDMGLIDAEYTDKKSLKSDEAVLSKADHVFVGKYTKLTKYYKARDTYLKGLLREAVDGFIHPVFNLHNVVSYRGSCNGPNFQNQPVRDPWMGAIIRRGFIPRKGRVLLENDYSGVEVSVAACYHKDPVMLSYILDPSKDMHRDMAAQCFKLKPEQVSKYHRYCGKNQFVFPQFYGDYYVNNAIALWDSIQKMDLKGPDGECLYDYLKKRGIKSRGKCTGSYKDKPSPGTFEYHMKEVEKDFWGNRFKVYGDWKKKWYSQYLRNGYFNTLTGFTIGGILGKNDVINYPVQGSAFHCLLWSLCRMVLKEIPAAGMDSLVVGQIHDSLIGDIPVGELDDYLALIKDVMTVQVKKYAPWLLVDLEVESEVSSLGGTWWDKKEISYDDSEYSLENDDKEIIKARTVQQLVKQL